MSSQGYFSYVRVSTQRQGQLGTSLSEQEAAIERYSKRFGLKIIRQYEERETAAKQGRPVFLELLKALKNGQAAGLIIHKIDRSARNLKDWADLGVLIDQGIEVHFANESLDLNSRGGRLSADIQAVVAADYIRNLREETKKGIYGRLRQGLFPFRARVGYLDAGKGKPKEVDPVQGPLVKHAFESYASGEFGLNALVEKMYELGLRNRNGNKVSRNGLVCILKNPFYFGLIKIEAAGVVFVGRHEPLVSRRLFNDVQMVFAGKRTKKNTRHFFVFRRCIKCGYCGRMLIPETQKTNVYYRCHLSACPQRSIREEVASAALINAYQKLHFNDIEKEYLKKCANDIEREQPAKNELLKRQLSMEEAQLEDRTLRLTDAFLDGVLDREAYLTKKNEILSSKEKLRGRMVILEAERVDLLKEVDEFLELLKSVYLSYKRANNFEKREMVKITTSNFVAKGKSVSVTLKKPFQMVVDRQTFPVGSPQLATSRTLKNLYHKIHSYFKRQVTLKTAGEEYDNGLFEYLAMKNPIRPKPLNLGFQKILNNKKRNQPSQYI